MFVLRKTGSSIRERSRENWPLNLNRWSCKKATMTLTMTRCSCSKVQTFLLITLSLASHNLNLCSLQFSSKYLAACLLISIHQSIYLILSHSLARSLSLSLSIYLLLAFNLARLFARSLAFQQVDRCSSARARDLLRSLQHCKLVQRAPLNESGNVLKDLVYLGTQSEAPDSRLELATKQIWPARVC